MVERLARRARQDLCIRRSTAGLFFGLVPGAVVSLLAGSVALPIPAFPLVLGLAAAGCATGLVSALFSAVDRRRLLINADRSLGSRELASTAFELAGSADPGIFAGAVLEDAAQLLARASPRAILGRLRLPLAPPAVLAALVATACLLFPLDLRGLFPGKPAPDPQLAQIGEDLRNRGLRLAEEARAHDLGRSLALSQQLAQLGSDLAANRIQPEDALERTSELESGLAEEYQLRMQEVQGDTSLTDRGGTESALGDALDRLREARRQLGRGAPSGSPPGLRGLPPGQGDRSAQRGRDHGVDSEGAGADAENPGRSGQSGGSGIGSVPAPVKRGTPSAIIDNTIGPRLRVQGTPSEGDSTRLLARALPRWNGSRLPEEAIINRYSRQAESAFARDEIPLQLKEYVKQYFTVIGIAK